MFLGMLITFMLAAPLMKTGVDVTPPTMNADKLPTKKTMRSLSITKNGTLTYEKQPISEAELLRTLQNLQRTEPSAVLLLRADGEREYKEVINIMRIIQDSGFKNVQLVTLSDGTEQ